MPQPKKAAPAGKAGAAVAEAKSESLTVKVHGLTLTLPPGGAPPSMLMDMVLLERADSGVAEYIAEQRVLLSCVGDDQYVEIRNKVGDDPEKVSEVLSAVLDRLGLSMGESSASQES